MLGLRYSGPTSPKTSRCPNHRLLKLHNGLKTPWILCLSILQSLGAWFPNFLSSENLIWILWTTEFRSGLILECNSCSPFPEDICAWSTDTRISPLLVNLSQVLESTFLHNPLKVTVIPVACAQFSLPVIFPLAWFSSGTPQTDCLFSNDLLCLT